MAAATRGPEGAAKSLGASYGAPPTLVLDCGSGFSKAGLALDGDAPSVAMPTVIGRMRHVLEQPKPAVGEEAIEKRGLLLIKYPVEYGVVTNWTDMELVWANLVEERLNVKSEEHPVLLSEPSLTPKANREKATQIWFETFNVPGFYLAKAPALALMGTGQVTGMVADIGDGEPDIVPVYDGYILPHCIMRHGPPGGRVLTDFLMKILGERGYSFTTTAERDLVRGMKEQLCYVATDYEAEMQVPEGELERTYELPDGNKVTLGNQRFRCPEPLFQPSFLGMETMGLHEQIYNSLMKADEDIRSSLAKHVLLAGGSANFFGLDERLEKELVDLVAPKFPVHVMEAPPDRENLVWRGGALVAMTSTFLDMVITKEDYDENGPSIVHRKCF